MLTSGFRILVCRYAPIYEIGHGHYLAPPFLLHVQTIMVAESAYFVSLSRSMTGNVKEACDYPIWSS